MKIPKRELKRQKELQALIDSYKVLTANEIEMIYDEWNPAMIDSISMNGVYFTPSGLCRDVAALAHVRGNVIDCCAGIGKMGWWCKQYDSYNKQITSLTCIELILIS